MHMTYSTGRAGMKETLKSVPPKCAKLMIPLPRITPEEAQHWEKMKQWVLKADGEGESD